MKIEKIIEILIHETKNLPPTLIDTIIKEYGPSPYLILIACLLSLRAKDITTVHVCRVLFDKAKTPKQMIVLSQQELEETIFTAGFYKQKSKTILHVSKILIEKYHYSEDDIIIRG